MKIAENFRQNNWKDRLALSDDGGKQREWVVGQVDEIRNSILGKVSLKFEFQVDISNRHLYLNLEIGGKCKLER